MSTTFNISSVLSAISSLEAQLAALKAQLGGAPAAAVSVLSTASASGKKAKKEKKVKDPNAPKRERSSWGAFTDRVRALLQSNGYTGKAVSTECVQFCADLKKETPDFSAWEDADILSRRAAWTKPEVSKQRESGFQWRNGKKVKIPESDIEDGGAIGAGAGAATTSSVVSESSSVKEKKQRKPRAAPAAAAAAVAATSSSVVSESSSVKEKKPRKQRAAAATTSSVSSVTAAALVPLPPSPPASVAPIVPLKKVIIGKTKYLVHLDSGHAWHYAEDENGKPVKGEWAGLFSAPSVNGAGQKVNAKVDSSVPDPSEVE